MQLLTASKQCSLLCTVGNQSKCRNYQGFQNRYNYCRYQVLNHLVPPLSQIVQQVATCYVFNDQEHRFLGGTAAHHVDDVRMIPDSLHQIDLVEEVPPLLAVLRSSCIEGEMGHVWMEGEKSNRRGHSTRYNHRQTHADIGTGQEVQPQVQAQTYTDTHTHALTHKHVKHIHIDKHRHRHR